MVWVFSAIAIGSIVFGVRIMLEHLRAAQKLQDQRIVLRTERERLEEEIAAHQAKAEEWKSQLEEKQKIITEREGTLANLRAQVDRTTKERERRGRYKIEE